MSVLCSFCVLAVALWATAAVADPSSLWNILHPTGCSSAAFTPQLGGLYNVTIWDRCQSTAESVMLDVKCGWPQIPAENFTVVAYPNFVWSSDYAFGSFSYITGVHLMSYACFDPLQRTLTYQWNVRYPNQNEDGDSVWVSNDASADFWFDTHSWSTTGVYSFMSTVWDGCYTYQHNISVHWDGNQPRVVPSVTPLQSRQATGCTKFSVKLVDSSKDVIYGLHTQWLWDAFARYQNRYDLNYKDDPTSFAFWSEGTLNNEYSDWSDSQNKQWWQTLLVAEVSPAASPNGKLPNNYTLISWDLVVPDDKVVAYFDGVGDIDTKHYIVVDKAFWPTGLAYPTVTNSINYTRSTYNSWAPGGNNPQSGYFYPGNASSPMYTYYDRSAYSNIQVWQASKKHDSWIQSQTFVQYSTFITSTSSWYNVPACQLTLKRSRGAMAWFSAAPVPNAVKNDVSCTGLYYVNVTAQSYYYDEDSDENILGCAQTDTQAVSVSCGLPPEIRPDPTNPKVVTMDPTVGAPSGPTNYWAVQGGDWGSVSYQNTINLKVGVYDSWGVDRHSYNGGGSYLNGKIRWTVVSEPAGSSVGADMDAAYAQFQKTVVANSWNFNNEVQMYSGYSTYSGLSGQANSVYFQPKPPIGSNLQIRPIIPGTYVFNVTYWDGCISTSVLEYLTLSCPTAPSVTFPSGYASLSVATNNFDGGNSVYNLPYAITISDSTADADYYRRQVVMTGYPTNLPWFVKSDTIPTNAGLSGTWLSTFKPWAVGTYTFSVTTDHGCGTRSVATLSYTLTCANAGTVGVDATDSTYTASISNRHSTSIALHGTFTQTSAYTSPPNNLLHTWILQTKDGVAVTTDQQVNTVKTVQTGGGNTASGTAQTSANWKFDPTNNDLPVGVYVFKHIVTDGCKTDTATHTMTITCNSQNNIYGFSIHGDNDGSVFPYSENIAMVGTQFKIVASLSANSPSFAWTTTSDKIQIGSSSSATLYVFALATGTATVTLSVTDQCGFVNSTTYSFAIVDTATPTVNNPCSAVTVVPTYNAYKVTTDSPRAVVAVSGSIVAGTPIEIPFSGNHFPQVVLSVNGTDFGSDTRRSNSFMSVTVQSAPAGSVYAPLNEDDTSYGFFWQNYIDYWMTDATTGVTTHKSQFWRYDTAYTGYNLVNSDRSFFATFLADYAGTYVLNLIVQSDCRTSSPSGSSVTTVQATLKFTCPTAPSLVLKDRAGAPITTSTANPTIVYVSNTWDGTETTVLDASKSTRGNAAYPIYYHWYWKSVYHGYDQDAGEMIDDHVGLGTPFASVLTLDAKLIPPSHNGRELMLTISDGCQNVTTAVRIQVVCNGANVNLQADRGALVLDPAVCLNKINLKTGVCMNHYDFISVTLMPALSSTTAAALADTAFNLNYQPVQQESSGPNKLAIGLGIGLGLGLPILCLIGYCVYRSTRQRAPIKDSSSSHQHQPQHQQQHHEAAAPVAEPAPAASPANTNEDNNLAQNNGHPPSAVEDHKEAAAPPV